MGKNDINISRYSYKLFLAILVIILTSAGLNSLLLSQKIDPEREQQEPEKQPEKSSESPLTPEQKQDLERLSEQELEKTSETPPEQITSSSEKQADIPITTPITQPTTSDQQKGITLSNDLASSSASDQIAFLQSLQARDLATSSPDFINSLTSLIESTAQRAALNQVTTTQEITISWRALFGEFIERLIQAWRITFGPLQQALTRLYYSAWHSFIIFNQHPSLVFQELDAQTIKTLFMLWPEIKQRFTDAALTTTKLTITRPLILEDAQFIADYFPNITHLDVSGTVTPTGITEQPRITPFVKSNLSDFFEKLPKTITTLNLSYNNLDDTLFIGLVGSRLRESLNTLILAGNSSLTDGAASWLGGLKKITTLDLRNNNQIEPNSFVEKLPDDFSNKLTTLGIGDVIPGQALEFILMIDTLKTKTPALKTLYLSMQPAWSKEAKSQGSATRKAIQNQAQKTFGNKKPRITFTYGPVH